MVRNERGNTLVSFILFGIILCGLLMFLADKFIEEMKQNPLTRQKESKSETAAVEVKTSTSTKTRFIRPATLADVGKENKPWAQLRGRVFYMRTAEPAANVEVVFEDLGSGTYSAVTTDARGRFRAGLLVSNEGYHMTLERDGKPLAYIEDWTPSISTFAAEKRGDLADDRLRRRVDPDPLFVADGQIYQKDFAVALPRTKPKKVDNETILEVAPVSSSPG